MTDQDNTEKKEVKAKVTEADKIWEDISGREIAMYALKNQTIADHLEKLPVPGKVLYAKPKSPAVIAALDGALGDEFEVNPTEKGYLQITRVEKLPEVEDDFVVFERNGKVEKIPRKKYLGSE